MGMFVCVCVCVSMMHRLICIHIILCEFCQILFHVLVKQTLRTLKFDVYKTFCYQFNIHRNYGSNVYCAVDLSVTLSDQLVVSNRC